MFREILSTTLLICSLCQLARASEPSVARNWNEQLLGAIRNDTARPTIHARNLYHVSAAMYDAWAAYGRTGLQVLHQERASATDVNSARNEAISFAAYRRLRHRFVDGPGGTGPGKEITAIALEEQMLDLGYDLSFDSVDGDSPAALGNRIAQSVIEYGLRDGANGVEDYADPSDYKATNVPMIFDVPGTMATEPNRWQP